MRQPHQRQLRSVYCPLVIVFCFALVSCGGAKHHNHAHPTLQPRDLSLDQVGSKAFSVEELFSAEGFGGNSAVTSNSLEASTRLRQSRKLGSSSFIFAAGLFIWVFVALCLLVVPWTGGSDALKSPRSPRSPRSLRVESALPPSQAAAASSNAVPTSDDPTPQVRVGSFARRYNQAKGQDRQALELLRRCNVIPQEEFQRENVSHEHIEECIWVAKVMLLQKPLDVWVGLGYEDGQKSFKDTVAAINSARENARVNAPDGEIPEPVKQHVQRPDSPRPQDNELSPDSQRSMHKDTSAVSLGSSVSFGAEGAIDPGSAPPTLQVVISPPATVPECPSQSSLPSQSFSFTAPPTVPSVPPQSYSQMPAPSVPPQSYVAGNQALLDYGKSPVPILNCYNQVDDNAPPSSNEGIGSLMPSAQSLTSLPGSDGPGFLAVLAPSPSIGLVSPPNTQKEIPETSASMAIPPASMASYMANPTASMASYNPANPYMANPTGSMASYNPTASMGSMSPGKRFTFAAQEVHVAPLQPSATQEDLPRPPASMTTSQVSLRPLSEAQVRKFHSQASLS